MAHICSATFNMGDRRFSNNIIMAIVGVVHHIWWTPQLFSFFQISFMGCPCACHVAALDWATWKPLIGPLYPLSCQHAMPTVQTSMWHDLIGPWSGPKHQKPGDTWKPLVLPCQHATCHFSAHATCHFPSPSTCVV
jgi:hypothetical protein